MKLSFILVTPHIMTHYEDFDALLETVLLPLNLDNHTIQHVFGLLIRGETVGIRGADGLSHLTAGVYV